MEIKFTVPGPPKGQRDVASMSHTKKARAMSLFACAETGRELPARAPRRPRICKVNGRSVAYTAKETIEYENLIRASYTAGSKAKFERSLPLEISILAMEVRILEARCWRQNIKICESFVSIFAKRLQYI